MHQALQRRTETGRHYEDLWKQVTLKPDEVYKNCARVEQIDDFLHNYGFVRVETSWDGGIWGDAFYIKRDSNEFLKSVAMLTYSHSSFNDVLDIYFIQLTKYFPQINGYLLIDKPFPDVPSNHKVIYYDNNVYYCKHILNALNSINEDYIIYMQDDYFLIDEPKINILNESLSKIISENLDFIRLIRTGDDKIDLDNIFHEISTNSKFLFSTQATIWKKKSLYRLIDYSYNKYPTDNIWESELRLNEVALKFKIKGKFLYKNENKRGECHWDSNYFPYIM